MSHSYALAVSAMCLVAGVAMMLWPASMLRLSRALNRSIVAFDEPMIRHRRVMSLLLFTASYSMFRVALWMVR